MKFPSIVLLILLCKMSFSQMNMDSLMNHISNSKICKVVGPVKYMTRNFQRFESVDKLQLYDVCLDSTGKLSNYIDLSIVHKTFDEQGRLLKIIGYGPEGTYSFWDFSPITEFIYRNDTTIETEYNYKYKFLSKKTSITDDKKRIIEIFYEDAKSAYFDRTLNTYNDSLNTLTIASYDERNILKKDKNGVAFIYQKFDSNRKNIIEQQFLDARHKLIDGKHKFDHMQTDCIFSRIYREYEEGAWTSHYYNAAGKEVCEERNLGIFIYSH